MDEEVNSIGLKEQSIINIGCLIESGMIQFFNWIGEGGQVQDRSWNQFLEGEG